VCYNYDGYGTRAQKFFNDNIFAMFAGKLIGLISVLAIPSILQILDYTKESGTSMKAYRRYLATIYHTVTWYKEELKPGTKSWKSLSAVRKRHVISSKFAEKGQCGFISQKDMAFTQFGFLGYIAIKPEILGIQATDEDLEAFIHFWRVIGYMIGLDDKYNLCTDSWSTTKPRLEAMLSHVFRPSLDISSASEKFTEMSRALITGLWCFNPFLSFDAHMFFMKMVAGCRSYDYFEKNVSNQLETKANLEKLGWYDRVVLYLLSLAHTCWLNITILRWYFNSQIHLSLVIIHYFPFLAFYKFGIRDSYVRILKGDKS